MENPIETILRATREMEAATSRMEAVAAMFHQVQHTQLLFTIEQAIEKFGFKRADFRTEIILPIEGSGGSAPNRYHLDDLIALADKLRRKPLPTMTMTRTKKRVA